VAPHGSEAVRCAIAAAAPVRPTVKVTGREPSADRTPDPRDLAANARSLTDTHGRHRRDLRLSITDRCNLRCVYCMPAEACRGSQAGPAQLRGAGFARVCLEWASLGVRLTGGEPTCARTLPVLVRMLSELAPGLDLALTPTASSFRSSPRAARRGIDAGQREPRHAPACALSRARPPRPPRRGAGGARRRPRRRVQADQDQRGAHARHQRRRGRRSRAGRRDEGYELRFIEWMPSTSSTAGTALSSCQLTRYFPSLHRHSRSSRRKATIPSAPRATFRYRDGPGAWA